MAIVFLIALSLVAVSALVVGLEYFSFAPLLDLLLGELTATDAAAALLPLLCFGIVFVCFLLAYVLDQLQVTKRRLSQLSLEWTCPSCSKVNLPLAGFCNNCGRGKAE